MKEFDVHFKVDFSDCLHGIEANSKEEAIDKAGDILKRVIGNRVIALLETRDYETYVTDVLTKEEVGQI
jgi:hypothetical protein